MSTTTPGRRVSAVIPVYNSAPGLEALLTRLEAALRETCDEFEVVLVNDGSRDASWARIGELASERDWVHAIDLRRNYGQHNALLCGVRAARLPTIVTLDDDLQNAPEDIPTLLDQLERGFDVVYGTPREQKHGLLRDLASTISKITLRHAMQAETARHVSAFRAFHRDIRESFAAFTGPYVSLDVLLTWGAGRFTHVEVEQHERAVGSSNYTARKLFRHAFNMLTGFSAVPLRIASVTGLAFSGVGVLLLVFVLGRYLLEGVAVEGFAFTASAITLFAGVQLFALGVIGEYIARIHFRTMERPSYCVRETRSAADGDETLT